jgi:hypothetical protein
VVRTQYTDYACRTNFVPLHFRTLFIGDFQRQQQLQLGFVSYYVGNNADKVSHAVQTGSRGIMRRHHSVKEVRSYICGLVKRNDPVRQVLAVRTACETYTDFVHSRRFIQYLSMETGRIRALVRDQKTGLIVHQPPTEELWLVREKSGFGRANKYGISS